MTALSIQPPFPIITDIDGQPLEDGYIWIGTAGLNPIGNPISVYWDAALSVPAALPVRTRGGYPMRSGTPARLYVNSDYSLLVQNKNGSTVYSALTATERLSGVVVEVDATDVTFLQAGSGAVVRTAQAKMRDVVSVKDFGAVGDGVADDTAAIQAALTAATGQILYFPEGTYMVAAGSNDTSPSGAYTIFKGALSVPSNSTIEMDPNAVVKCITTNLPSGSAFFVYQATNVIIRGGTVLGDRTTHTGVGGEQLHGIYVSGSSNVRIESVNVKDWWGDGIIVRQDGAGTQSSYVSVDKVICDNNRRNGMTLSAVSFVQVSNSAFINTNGTLPQAGVDCEPDSGFSVAYAKFVNCQFNSNTKSGFMAAPQGTANANGLELVNCSAVSNGQYGFEIEGDSVNVINAAILTNCHAINNASHGFFSSNNRDCVYTGCVARGNSGNGFLIRGEANWTRLTATSSSGNFTVGETVSNGSGVTAKVQVWVSASKTLLLSNVSGGSFSPGNTVTGGTSGATFTVVSSANEAMSADNQFIGCGAQNNTTHGFFTETTTDRNVFDGCSGNGNINGIQSDAGGHIITGGRYTFNGTYGINIRSGSSSNFISGVAAIGNTSGGIRVQGTDCLVQSCYVRAAGIQGAGVIFDSTNGYNRLVSCDVYNSARFTNIVRTDTTTVLINNMEVQNSLSTFQNVNTPEGAVVAPRGSVYQRTDGGAGTSIYIKESGTGNTGWVAK
jgi:hypothetical protein